MWNELSAAIKAKIVTSAEIDSAAVFEYAKSKMVKYPTITITPAENQNTSFADTTRRRRSYTFAVRVYQERTERSEEESERILRTLIDDLIDIFDADIYLNNALAGRGFAFPIPSSWSFVTGEQVNTRMAEILIECVVIQ